MAMFTLSSGVNKTLVRLLPVLALALASSSFANDSAQSKTVAQSPIDKLAANEFKAPLKSSLIAPNEEATLSQAVQQGLGFGARFLGAGELTWLGFRVYEAQLWVAQKSELSVQTKAGQSSNYADQNFALEIRYLRTLSGEAIADRSLVEIKKLGIGNAEQHQAWLAEMKKLIPSVKKGDRLTGVHLAGVGAAYYLNDKFLGRVDDAGFANAFFAIWLDPKTSAPGLRAALLSAKPS